MFVIGLYKQIYWPEYIDGWRSSCLLFTFNFSKRLQLHGLTTMSHRVIVDLIPLYTFDLDVQDVYK